MFNDDGNNNINNPVTNSNPNGRFPENENTQSTPLNYGTVSPSTNNFSSDFNGGGGNSSDEPPKPKKKQKYLTKNFAVVLVVVCVVASFAIGIVGGAVGTSLFGKNNGLNLNVASHSDTGESTATYTGDNMTAEEVANFAADSVVEITTESVQKGSWLQQYVTQGAGSGVIVSSDGYIITNNHVISGSSKITVKLKNSTSYQATVVGSDSDLDVALLKIDATDLKPVVFGDSSSLKVGEDIIAIGNPLGELGGTVTKGIISALDREISVENSKMSLLQIDAAINPGNSGGGLFNMKGEFVGLVVAKSSGSDVEGLGFAIPGNKVRNAIEDLKAHGYVTGKPSLGVTLTKISTTQQAKQYGVSQLGVYIVKVDQGSAAEEAGLQVKDCIISVDSQAVSSIEDVSSIVKSHNVGDTITLSIIRDGQAMNVQATLKESTATNSSSSSATSSQSQTTDPFQYFFGY